MSQRRFTDRDVALILRRAVELDKDAPQESSVRGLTLRDLQEIASEVGIDPASVTRAVEELEGRRGPGSVSYLGPAPVNRQIRALPGELTREVLGELVRIVDRTVPAHGTITEALGSVRWSAQGRILSRQVSLEPSQEETLIRVEERFTDRFRGALHAIPAVYGAAFGWLIGLDVGGAGAAAILGALVAVGGFTGARVVWNMVCKSSWGRVRALADQLAGEATKLSEASGTSVAEH